MVKHRGICPHCRGNGFIRVSVSSYDEVRQCETCKSQGEVDVEEPTIEELKALEDSARKVH